MRCEWRDITTLKMGTEMVAETLMGFKELTRMKAREDIDSVY
jgi:hypothetical protein